MKVNDIDASGAGMSYDWVDTSKGANTTESAIVNGHLVTVSLDDEGVIGPAFYWLIDNRRDHHNGHWHDGWAGSVDQAKYDAATAAEEMD